MRHPPRRWTLALILPLLATPAGAAENIFDDGWEPPARKTEPVTPPRPATPTPQPPAPTPAPAPVKPPAAVDPVAPPVVAQPVVVTPVVVTPVAPILAEQAKRNSPTPEQQAKVRILMREVYAPELADRTPAARRALATKLARVAHESRANPAEEFVLYAGAYEAAREGLDLAACFKVVDALDRLYRVDAAAWRAAAALKLAYRVDPARTEANVRAALPVVDRLIADEDFAAAAKLAALLQAGAVGQPALVKLVQAKVQAVSAIKATHERAKRDLETLAATPDDPAANAGAGRFACYVRRQWDRGLPLLAKGNDAPARAAAQAELATPAPAGVAAVALADQWWAVAESQPESLRTAIIVHAAEWYRRGLPAVGPGLKKALVEKRLADVAEIEPPAPDPTAVASAVEPPAPATPVKPAPPAPVAPEKVTPAKPAALAEEPVAVSAKSEVGYAVGPLAKGDQLVLQYAGGKWKGWGRLATESPDTTKIPKCQAALCDHPAGGAASVVAIVPTDTQATPYTFTADRDYANLVIRINDDDGTFDNNPDNGVKYRVRVVKARR
ncbi:MAG: hypothetical protein ACAI43_19730 [Phycisphaerae bacterium]